MKKIRVGIIATQKDTSESLRLQVAQTGIAVLGIQVDDASLSPTDDSARKLIEANPEVIIVEIREAATGLQTLQVLQVALPKARLLVTSNVTDPQLIIEAMRSGAREFLSNPVSPTALLEALNRYIVERDRTTNHLPAQRGKLYCITSAKHGSGATTLAVNLAGIIAARSKQSTALLDLDRPVGDAAAYLNLKPSFTVSDALAAGPRLDSVLLESFMQASNGFHLLAGFREYASNTSIPADRLAQLLEVSQGTFAFTIVDLPPTLSEEQVQVIVRNSQTVMVVLTPELPAIWRTERLLSYLTKLEASDKVRVILNRSSSADEIGDVDIERLLRHPIHCRMPNDYRACIKAINSGHLLESASSKQLFRAVHSLASELAGIPETENRRGILGLFLKPSPIGGSIGA